MAHNPNYQYREIITPLRNPPFSKIRNVKKRAIFGMYMMLGFRKLDIARITNTSEVTVHIYIKQGKKKYPDIKRLIY